MASAMTCEVASVYTEIGLQAGILLIKDMIQNLGVTSQADYQVMYCLTKQKLKNL